MRAYWKEPDEIVKLAIGALIAGRRAMLPRARERDAEAATGEKVSLLWGLGFHIVNDIGFAMIFPVGLALFSRAAPRQVGGTSSASTTCTCSSAISPPERSRE